MTRISPFPTERRTCIRNQSTLPVIGKAYLRYTFGEIATADGDAAYIVEAKYDVAWPRMLLVLRKLGFDVKDLGFQAPVEDGDDIKIVVNPESDR